MLKGLKILTPKEMTVTKPIFIKEVIDANAVDSTVPLQQGLWKMGGFFAKKSGRKEGMYVSLEWFKIFIQTAVRQQYFTFVHSTKGASKKTKQE